MGNAVAPRTTGTTGKYDSIHPADGRLPSLSGAADILGISRSKAHQLAVGDELETVRVGRRLLIVVESGRAGPLPRRASTSGSEGGGR
jgi:hypothetical protein